MIEGTTAWIVQWLVFLGDWSIRWGVVLAALALWFALRPPRRAATRHAVCAAGLAAGLLLPVMPRLGRATIFWPAVTQGAPSPASRTQSEPWMSIDRVFETVTPASPVKRPASLDAPSDPIRSPRGAPPLGGDAGLIAAWALVVIWALAVMILSIRLLGGSRWLARLRREAREVGAMSRMLKDECGKSLRLSRHAGLATHPAVASPVTLAGFRPLILVPPDWDTWPELHRRACLLHELAHLARHDDWAKFVQELIRIPLFFHPLVRWLLNRLDRERELLCDEAVVVCGVDAVAYARLLLDLGRRPGRVVRGATALRSGALPFLDRRTLSVRIERLLEDDMGRTLLPFSRPRLFVLGAVILAAALSVASLRVRAVEAQEKSTIGNLQAAQATDKSVIPPSRTVKGVVVDLEDNPVSGAVVVGGLTDTGTTNHRIFTTDSEGRFAWPIETDGKRVRLYAHKPGRALGFQSYWVDPKNTRDSIELKLGNVTAEPFAAVLVDSENRPVVGASIWIEMRAQNWESKLPDGGSRWGGSSFTHYAREVLGGSPLEPLLVTTTDEHGAFSFRAFGPDAWLRLAVTTSDGRKMRVKRRTRAVETIATMMDGQGFVSASTGKETSLVAYPAARVQGRVVTKLPGVRVSGLVVSFGASRVREDLPAYFPNFGGVTRTDADGRFTFDGLNEGTINIFADKGANDAGWTYRAAQDVELKSGWTRSVLITLIQGVEVEGKVVAGSNGEPLRGANIGVHGPMRPRSGAGVLGATTDDEGRFRFRLPPGENYFYVMGHPPGHADCTVIIPDGVARFEIPTIVMGHRLIARGRVVDSAGKAVKGATVVCVGENGRVFRFGGGDAVTDTLGAFQLPGSPNNSIPIGKAARLRLRLTDGSEHEVTVVPLDDGSVTVKLSFPAGKN